MHERDITTEEWREYRYAGGERYRIEQPSRLFLKQDDKGDSHRILDREGVTHYVRRGWVAIAWRAPDAPVSF